jgi:hypothetical protein
MRNKFTDLDFAISLLEKKYDNYRNRYDVLNQKISIYIAVITISVSVISIFIRNVSDKIKLSIMNVINKDGICNIIISKEILFIILFLLPIGSIIYILYQIIQCITPKTFQEIDNESIDLAIDNQIEKSKNVYIKDLKSVIENNKIVVNNRYSKLLTINRWLIIFVISFLFLFVSSMFI